MFLGGAVSSSAFFINNGLQVTETNRGGEFTTSENENLDDVTANAPTNDGHWTDPRKYATSFAGGSGTSTNPYLISTPQQLARLAYLINGSSSSSYRSLYYEQTANLNMSAYWWDAIGYSTSYYFGGHYNGGGFTIAGLYTEAGTTSSYSYQGLFGYIKGTTSNFAEIHDVGIIDSNIQGYLYAGGIAGYAYSSSTITNCYNTGSVTGSYSVGGIAGYADSSSTITNCYNTGSVSGSAGSDSSVGGIAGYAYSSSTITNCYNTGSVTGSYSVGGIAGNASDSTITNCYNTGSVTGSNYVGGIAGSAYSSTITNCYNTGSVSGNNRVGGIAGYIYSSTIRNCYWGGNCTLSVAVGSGYYATNCGTCTIEEVKSLSWYSDSSNWYSSYPWDFENTWAITEGVNDGLPYLRDMTWSMSFTITYHPNGASGSEVVESKVGSESYTIRSNMFSRSGYNFTGWNTQANGGGQSYSAGSSYSGLANLDLYAQWSRITYTIKYNKNASDATGSMANTTKYHGTNVTLRSNAFKRTGYTFLGWATEKNGDMVYSNGATYKANANVTLYAKWDPHKYTIVFNGNGSTSGSMKEQTFEYGKEQKLTSNAFKKTGFTFSKWTRNADGTGTSYTNGQSVKNLTSTNGAEIKLYAQWKANNEAKYDNAGKYWYVENGKIPQTKVTNSTLISNLNKATTNGANYYIAGQTLTAKVYSGKEYCKWNNNWYEVEPIKWRLDYSSSQKDGYGTTTDTNAVLAEIVYIDQYSSSSIDAGEGYSNQSVTDFMRNGISTTYLVNYATSTQTFGTGTSLYGTNASTTARMFVSSQSEVTNVVGNMNMTFSDLVEDMIKYYGGTNVYFTRDLGSNYNNIVCFNEVGREVQRFATDYRGLQFTVRFTEYGCVA